MTMKKSGILFLLALLAGNVAFAESSQVPTAEAAAPSSPAAQWEEDWYSGAEGYAEALAEYEKTHKPMAVYINVTWCPYCRKFEKEVLSDPEVRKAMKDIIKVRVNPEDGQKENAIAFQYGVTGFPSFFVHPPQPSSTVRLYTGVAPAQFVGLLKKILK